MIKMPKDSLGLESNIWYDRDAGNAYHTVRIIIDGNPVWTSPVEFGDNYEQTAKEWLNSNGLNITTHLRIWAEDMNNLEFDRRERKVNKRELTKYDSFFPKKEYLDSKSRWSKKVKEYVIWGIPEGSEEDTLLLARVGGEVITSRQEAEKYAKLLEGKYNATKTRIQEIDLSQELNWKKEIGLNRRSKIKIEASTEEDEYWDKVDEAVEEYLDNEWRGTISYLTGETPDEWDWDLLERLADVYGVNLEDIMGVISEE